MAEQWNIHHPWDQYHAKYMAILSKALILYPAQSPFRHVKSKSFHEEKLCIYLLYKSLRFKQ